MRILISAGGTGGHIYPALAIIEGFKKYDKDLEVLYIGTKNRMEKDIVPKNGIPYYGIEIYGLSKNIFKDIKDVFLIFKAKKEIKKKMLEFKPDVVLGIGGYVTYPVLSVAKSLHIKTFIHEQNAIPGKTNKMISKYADIIGISFKESAKYFPNKNVLYTGNPTGIRALNTPRITKSSLGLNDDKPLVVVVCGSLGSETVNNAMKGYLKTLENKDYQVVYITGKNLYEEFIKIKYPKNVKVLPYLDNLTGLLKETDVLVARAGASTIAEVLSLKVPTIFIPSPYVANNHQYYNAVSLKNDNLALMLEEKDLSIPNITKNIEDLLYNKDKQIKIKNNLNKVSTLDSTKIIYDAIKELIKK
ncbi:uDP-N-acetylglucosamine--N-acetylmuramyl-(pentapeptide) pyrophosphoryl-undecaprenol N-acetylglucosamine transferase [Mycoplasma sp. CAG:956]|nr:uDP-N-acetylglucosamine--N-acetylmuramyl-(pentapeptide) pyrophosphoryl-undecaprenol N-acetylglucosamine transferase [Mycoplasma sp. CAG:956]